MTSLKQIVQRQDLHEKKDDLRHSQNLKRFKTVNGAILAVHKRMGELATKDDLTTSRAATNAETTAILEKITNLEVTTKDSVETIKAAKYGLGLISVSGSTLIKFALFISAVVALIKYGWAAIIYLFARQ